MKLYYNLIFSVLTFLKLSIPVSGQTVVNGNWKPVSFKMKGSMQWQKDTFSIDLTTPQLTKDYLYKIAINKSTAINKNSAKYKAKIKHQIDSIFKKFQEAKLILNSDSSFNMLSNGFIFLNTLPGWSFGNSLVGTWTLKDETHLTLSIGNKKGEYSIYYNIKELDFSNMVLQELNSFDSTEIKEIKFKR